MAKKDSKEVAGVLVTLRKMVLASVGAVGVAQDEVIHLIDRMVERGEITEKDARKLLNDARKEFNKRRKSSQTQAEKEMEGLMDKFNVPSKADLEDLTRQVAHLSRRIEELKAELKKQE